MIVTHAKNRYGSVYPYFVCLGDTRRPLPALARRSIPTVERLVEDHYATVRLEPELRRAIESVLNDELVGASARPTPNYTI